MCVISINNESWFVDYDVCFYVVENDMIMKVFLYFVFCLVSDNCFEVLLGVI